ncbi:uncharacterized protein SPSK_09204 [Sporothrix schenckii 1099-18]|uniref:Uncharacterized protein n=2 Tax=Sporothrix schenckii TaxID=29908 RepID=U7PZN3_SPOS1|nr:uncharacterized protein SPSK_09204 [Sporothrix schenckii 1099-18]ERT00210.1 hypothetical protein HMPREF1624_03581 [Sporothrix schenckii ATCC 58251]KJR85334.1 hypothetical protein SPSK_09204 [Sporothrix schenckii 1099-18]
MSRYHRGDYDDEDEIDVRVFRRNKEASPPPPRVIARPPPVQGYYATGPAFLAAERTVATRPRSRSRERRSSPPPVIINNYNTQHSDDDSDSGHHGQLVPRRQGRSHSRAPSSDFMSREEYELEKARRELHEMKIRNAHANEELELHVRRNDREEWELQQARHELAHYRAEEHDRERKLRQQEEVEMARAKRELDAIKATQDKERSERMREKEYKSHAELERAKRELEEIRRREDRELEEKRIKKDLELKALEAQKKAQDEKERREKMEKEAIERYKVKEAERIAKEKAEKEENEREYKRRLQEDLLRSGVDEKDIKAILDKKSVKPEKNEKKRTDINIEIGGPVAQRPTYTRMARRHLSIETLNYYHIDFDYDQDPEYILVKRWVPEEERQFWWQHTKTIRENRKVVLKIEDGGKHHHHHHLEPEFEWVRKKERRRSRSKSPGLLMYLAGAK